MQRQSVVLSFEVESVELSVEVESEVELSLEVESMVEFEESVEVVFEESATASVELLVSYKNKGEAERTNLSLA